MAEALATFILFVMSANITISRITLLPIHEQRDREDRLTALSAMTTLIYMAMFAWAATKLFAA